MKVKTSTFVKIALGCAALLLTVAIISLYVQLGDLEKEKEQLGYHKNGEIVFIPAED